MIENHSVRGRVRPLAVPSVGEANGRNWGCSEGETLWQDKRAEQVVEDCLQSAISCMADQNMIVQEGVKRWQV